MKAGSSGRIWGREKLTMMKLGGVCVAFLLAFLGFCELDLLRQEQIIDKCIRNRKLCQDEATHNSVLIESLGRFAIQEHNKKENAFLEFAKVVEAQEHVVAGKIYNLTLEAIDAGKKKVYEAKISVDPWMNFIQLQKLVISPFSVKQEGHKLGWHEVPTDDPEVKDAAYEAVSWLSMAINCLHPHEILQANTKVIKDLVKFNLLLKVTVEGVDRRYLVEVNKKLGGELDGMSIWKLIPEFIKNHGQITLIPSKV